MIPFNTKDLDELLAPRPGPCVSIYLPTHRTGREMQQDRIRLKNLLKRAEMELGGVAIRGSTPEQVLAPVRALLPEEPFWENLGDGLAIFLAPGFSRVYALPVSFGELVVVAGAFHVKRVLPLVNGDGRFHVLAISLNRVRLLEGSRFTVTEKPAEVLPRSLADALGLEATGRLAQGAPGAPAPASGRRTASHGPGGPGAVDKADVLRYFRHIDEGIRELLPGGTEPLVLAGVERYFPLYREANRHPGLLEQGIPGNPDTLSARELHDRAWAVVAPRFRKAEEDALARFGGLAGQGRTTTRLEDIVPAAHHGRIDTLFVASGRQCWGAYLPGDGGSVVLHPAYEQGDQDLLDVAAAATIRTGGRVFPVAPEAVPAPAPAAAILRY